MLSLKLVREFIASLGLVKDDNVYIGKLDNKQKCSIGVYNREHDGAEQIPIGGRENGTFQEKRISLLIHWNKNPVEAEEIAYKLYNLLQQQKEFYMDTTYIHYIRMMVDEPKDVGTDDAGIYEYVIWVDFIYSERKD
nr:MAG TPA: hypothetical protein [Caudoviricetes sp.]